ncbi:CoA-binding protein [Nonomuraea sp. NPDC051191]|uniref:CoA-binding protein n=1 Tax=Nonomuraea sp. NPDC051191 TaxID=3364372 RepID=UPI0037BE0DDF
MIGASRNERAVGPKVRRNLIDGGFPVNLNAAEVAGLPCHDEVPEGVDLAVVAVPAARVLEVARDCAKAGVAGLVVLTSGFAKAGHPGAESELLRICRSSAMRLIGPNCLGIINTAAPREPRRQPGRTFRNVTLTTGWRNPESEGVGTISRVI